jgi:K+-transporting ATPase KdpF subunit
VTSGTRVVNKIGDSQWISFFSVSRFFFSQSPGGCSTAWIVSRKADEMIMLAGILAFGLLVYLMVALLKPEWF